jgi:hypothetical protein
MRRGLILGILVSFICTSPARGGNPSDIEFQLRLVKESHAFYMGESIEFEVTYSTQTERKYLAPRLVPRPDFGTGAVHLSPMDGVLDPRDYLRGFGGGSGGSIGSSGPQFLGSQQLIQRSDLRAWYRFQKPGHYSLTVTSSEVLRPKSPEEGDGQERIALESNPVEFDILPDDPSWNAQELSDILRELDAPSVSAEHFRAQYRLGLLDTPASVEKLSQLYLSGPDATRGNYENLLRVSSQIDSIIPLLEAALSNPTASPPSGITGLLAGLQVRKQSGVQDPYPDDAALQKQWQAKVEERRKAYDQYSARASDALLASLGRRSGVERNAALYAAWFNAEQQKGIAPEGLRALRQEMLDVSKDLQPEQQIQFLILAWGEMPHEQLLPLIRNLSSTYQDVVYQFWCEEWPRECADAILQSALKAGDQVPSYLILRMPEVEHPELDSVLAAPLADSSLLNDSQHAQRMAALILRAGSRNLLPQVDAALAQFAAQRADNCMVQGFLLGYLFKVGAEDAPKRLTKELRDESNACSTQVLRSLNNARYSDDLIPVAVTALSSPNLRAAGMAALFLGERGPESSKGPLWQRLNALWDRWRDQPAELSVVSSENGIGRQSADLEQDLASALSNAKNWELSTAERDLLRAGCLTEQCRSIADRKMRLGL